MWGVAFLVIAVLIIAIWVVIEIKRLRHKLFAIVLIALILIGYFGALIAFKGQEVDLKSVSGLLKATKIYSASWFSVFGNLRSITGNAIRMDWGVNESIDVKIPGIGSE